MHVRISQESAKGIQQQLAVMVLNILNSCLCMSFILPCWQTGTGIMLHKKPSKRDTPLSAWRWSSSISFTNTSTGITPAKMLYLSYPNALQLPLSTSKQCCVQTLYCSSNSISLHYTCDSKQGDWFPTEYCSRSVVITFRKSFLFCKACTLRSFLVWRG